MRNPFFSLKEFCSRLFTQTTPLEKRISYAMVLIAMVGEFFGFIESLVLHLTLAAILLPLLSFIIHIGLLLWGMKISRMDLFAFFAISITSMIIFPAMFLANAGLQGGMPFYFLLSLVCTALALKGKKRIILFILTMLEYTGLFLCFYFFPQIFIGMSKQDAFIDQLCSMIISSGILFAFSCAVSNQTMRDRETIKKLSQEYEKQANTDELTGLFNRRYFNSFLKLAIRTLGDSENLHLAMFDIDNFKSVNDRYGHPFGDTVLKQFSEILKKSEEYGSTVCRYGGEEFLILIPGRDRKQALSIVENILEETRTNIKIGDSFITVSAGFITCKEGMSYDLLLEEVDEKLYKAKCTGKNKVVS